MKLPLKRRKDAHFGIAWKEASPFIENSLAVLIHRPRYVTTHKIGEKCKAHIAVECWCGNTFTGTKKFTFLDAPPAHSAQPALAAMVLRRAIRAADRQAPQPPSGVAHLRLG